MRWSKARQQMLGKLQEIERARRSAAEIRLAGALEESRRAASARDEASVELASAETDWTRHHSRGRLDLELARLLSDRIVRTERELEARAHRAVAAEEKQDQELTLWRGLEARVRSGEDILKRGRRRLARDSEASRDQALSDRTTWRWFQR